jgi:hypothetical protein
MDIFQLLCSSHCPLANTPQLNCNLLFHLSWLKHLGTNHVENTILLLLHANSLPRERVYLAAAYKRLLFIRLISRSFHSNSCTRHDIIM